MATNDSMTDDMLTDDEREIITEEYIRSVKRELAKALAEIAHLRAREQALAAENEQKQAQIDAMRPVVEAVAKLAARETAENPIYSRDLVLHSDDINVLWLREQARAFVATYPATATAAGEAESEGE